MRAAVIQAPGAVPSHAEFEEPPASDERRVVSLVAAGLHPVVRALADGTHYGSHGLWPRIPGVDAVARTDDGTLVYTGFVEAPFGTFAERMSVPAVQMPLPAGADPVQVAATLNPGLSSWLPLVRHQAVGELACVLVVGATGIAGQLALQNAQALGVGQIIAAGRNTERLRGLRASGATITVNVSDPDGLGHVLAEHRPTLVLDYLWGAAATAVFDGLTRSGLDDDRSRTAYVEIGDGDGAIAQVPARTLRSSNLAISGGGVGATPLEEIMAQLPVYLARIAEGKASVPVKTYALSEVGAAWNDPDRGHRVVVTDA